MLPHRVVVTGVGVISPVANDKTQFWNSICQGRNGISRLTQIVDPTPYASQIAGEVKGFDPSKSFSSKEIRRMGRFVQFGVVAARMAVEDARVDISSEDPYRIGVIVGSGIGGLHVIEEQHKVLLSKGPNRISPFLIPMLISNMAPGQIAIDQGFRGPNTCEVTACASASHSIGEAFRIIQRGDSDLMIAGGTESSLTPLAVGGFSAMKALSTRNDDPEHASRPFDRDRDGFVMGEGAGIVILEELGHALKRGAHIYCELVGYGMTSDAYHMTAPSPDGEGPARCMKFAIEDAGLKPEEVSYINAHGTSTVLNDKVETLAIKKVFGESAKKIPVSSIKSMVGHLLGAAGGVEFIATAFSINEDLIPPTINYQNPDPDCDLDYVPNEARSCKVEVACSNSLGFGGHNATLVLKKFRE